MFYTLHVFANSGAMNRKSTAKKLVSTTVFQDVDLFSGNCSFGAQRF